MILYYITDRKQFGGTDAEQRSALLLCIGDAAAASVDYIQLREKDLTVRELEGLAKDALRSVRDHSISTRLLINSRTDVALAVGADGVHLTSDDIAASDARAVVSAKAGNSGTREFIVAASCHSVPEVRWAESHGADFVVLGPIFEKPGTNLPPLGLGCLKQASQSTTRDRRVEAGDNRDRIPVLALGGVTLTNAQKCVEAGAAGIAGIRLFQEGDLKEKLSMLREAKL